MENTPDKNGHFGIFGGRYIPETLITAHEELAKLYYSVKDDEDFRKEFHDLLKNYCGRPTPLYHAKKFSERVGAKVYLKREDLNHTGAHKVNNTIGQGLLAKRLGKKKLIAETGAGMHGVATATAAALLGMECEIFMGEIDVARQSQNVARMRMLGAKVNSVTSGSRTLKDAINEGLRAWISEVATTHYLMGTVAGSHPFPVIVRDFQSIIGVEARKQILEAEGKLPDLLVACVGGGSNAMGLFYPFVKDAEVEFIGVEAAGEGLDTGLHAASINRGSVGVIHGSMTYMLQDEDGQILETHSVSAGLDYPGVGPEHSHFHETGRAKYGWVTDEQAIEAFFALTTDEGIIPALESSHAFAYLMFNDSYKRNSKDNSKDNRKDNRKDYDKDKTIKDKTVIVNLSGRGDKDMQIVEDYLKSHGK